MDTTVFYAQCFTIKHVALGGEGDKFLQILENLQEKYIRSAESDNDPLTTN
jgi:hypothetical protein